jgi:acyl dehydratase
MKFADFKAGSVYALGPVIVDQDESITFAKQYDNQWFHVDPSLSEQGPWDGLITSGWFTCSLAMRLFSNEILHGSESYASPGLSNLRWLHPVRPGDALRLDVHVLDARRSASKEWLGVVKWRWRLFNQDAIEVLDVELSSLFKLD